MRKNHKGLTWWTKVDCTCGQHEATDIDTTLAHKATDIDTTLAHKVKRLTTQLAVATATKVVGFTTPIDLRFGTEEVGS